MHKTAFRRARLICKSPCSWDVKNRTWQLTDILRPAIVTLDWQRGGKTLFKSVNYAGYIGVLTAIKPVSI
ncbi:hypothetical protein DPMN_112191 [Dreissena polymorpha]|uniref:Uncharacterized protein n=1 Tax=Dreissena polymorpha TaxID=45954 RepID=A0A9D4KFM5_DREPO|nr:hypothetical protein DPMN_112191 [Dreissena polymorpha]